MKFKDLPKQAVGQVKSGIRKGFRFTTRKDYLWAAREELPRRTKTGKISVIPDVFYRCAKCDALWKEKEIQVDHIEPVVPIGTPEEEMGIGEYARNTFENKCQVLCKYCHKQKTTEENRLRKEKRLAK